MAKKKSLAAGRRALALFLAVSLVLTMASVPPGGPVGVASATHAECTSTDEFLWVFTLGYLGNPLALNQECDPSALSDHADELEALHENATKTDIYNTGAQAAADSEQFRGVMSNYIQDSGTVAMSKAEAAAVAAIDANQSRSEVEAAAVQAVEDYYTTKQMNLIDQWNVQVETVGTMELTSEAASLSTGFVSPDDGGLGSYTPNTFNGSGNPVGQHQPTLANGTTYISKTLTIGKSVGGQNDPHVTITVMSGPRGDQVVSTVVEASYVTVGPITGEPSIQAVNFTDYMNAWDGIVSKNAQLEANAQEYAGALYNQTQNGTANLSDYVSGATLAQEYATNYNDTGFYSYLVGFAATQGMAIPNLSTTSLMTIQTATTTYQGLLMSQNAPSGGVWEVGVTYNTANIQGKQFVATTDGELVELDGEFSITSMEGPEGQEVQNTTSQEITYVVTNESANYAELQEEIRTLREEIEQIEPVGGSGGGSGGGGFDFNLGSTGLVVIAAAAAAVLLLGRN